MQLRTKTLSHVRNDPRVMANKNDAARGGHFIVWNFQFGVGAMTRMCQGPEWVWVSFHSKDGDALKMTRVM